MPEMKDIAYEAHYKLLQHYSTLVLKVRVAITTVTLVVVGYATGVISNRSEGSEGESTLPFGIDDRAAVSILAATFVALLFQMALGYEKRFYQIIDCGKALEGDELKGTFFQEYDAGESWPIHLVFSLAVLILILIFLFRVWPPGDNYKRVATIWVACAIPAAVIGFALVKRWLIRPNR